MCLAHILRALRGKSQAKEKAQYSKVNTAADGDDDAGWGDSDDNWDWDGADVEAGGGGGPSSGSGAGSGASAGASGSRASEAAAAPPRGASPAPVAATTAAGVDSGISMPSTASARSVSSVTIPTAGVGPAGGGPPTSSSRRSNPRPSPVAAAASPPAKSSASNLFMELGMQPKIRAAKRIDPSTAPRAHRISVDMDDEDFGADWDVGGDLDDLDLGTGAADASPAQAQPTGDARRHKRGQRKKGKKKPARAVSLGATRI